MEEEKKKRLDLSRYEPINDKSTVDIIIADMAEEKIFPSDALRGVILQRIRKVSVQKYLVEKFQETKDKIQHKTTKKEAQK